MTAATASKVASIDTPDRTARAPVISWSVAQIGSRQHYAVPRAFAARGHLRTFYADAWCRRGRTLLQYGPKASRAAVGRFHSDLSSASVVEFSRSLWLHRFRRNRHDRWLHIGKTFGQKVRRHMERQMMSPDVDALFAFDTGALEALALMKERGIPSIVDQIDPARVEEEIVQEEAQRWPAWEKEAERAPQAYWNRLQAEWEIASLVLVNSRWTKQALVAQGVPQTKIILVPMAYEGTARSQEIARNRRLCRDPLTVAWLGQVTLRKGIQYFFDAARRLQAANIRFLVAGPVSISETAIACAPPNIKFVGRLTREQLSAFYEGADLFVLPTLSDGFAITQLEAMAHGVPVITTTHCGDVVTDGEDGIVVPIRDGAAIAEAIASLDADRHRLSTMSRRAWEKSRQFTLTQFADRVESAVSAYRSSLMPS